MLHNAAIDSSDVAYMSAPAGKTALYLASLQCKLITLKCPAPQMYKRSNNNKNVND